MRHTAIADGTDARQSCSTRRISYAASLMQKRCAEDKKHQAWQQAHDIPGNAMAAFRKVLKAQAHR
jgi:hypothetical protein